MARRAELRWLTVASFVETLSLAILLVNLASKHLPAVTSTAGPLHGFAYLVTIAVTLLVRPPMGTRMLAVVPGIGGLLVLRRIRAADGRRADTGDYRSSS